MGGDPGLRLRRGYLCTLCRHPHLRREIPMPFSPAPPPRPRFRQEIPIRSLSPLHPARAFGAPPPPPPSGRGPCPGVYQGSSRIRGGAGGPPCPALLQDLPMCWTVGISPLGVGPTGRGNLFPLPCLPRSNHLTSRRHPLPAPSAEDTHTLLPASPTPPAPAAGDTHALLPAPPTPPAPSALLPRPTPGGGSVCDIRGAAVPGV